MDASILPRMMKRSRPILRDGRLDVTSKVWQDRAIGIAFAHSGLRNSNKINGSNDYYSHTNVSRYPIFLHH